MKVMVAKRSAWVTVDGRSRNISKGHTFAHPDHDVVTRYPDLWEPLSLHFDVERAPAEPRRSPLRSKAKKD